MQQVPKGLATWAGIVAAVGQYAAAVAVFLEDPDKAIALGPLATATATLIAVIVGRMQQATAAAKNVPPLVTLRQPVPFTQIWGGDGDDVDGEAPLPDPTLYDPELDEPGGQLTREGHSYLSGG